MKIVTASLLTVSGLRRLRDSNYLRGPAGS
jgi:hypothetical protein